MESVERESRGVLAFDDPGLTPEISLGEIAEQIPNLERLNGRDLKRPLGDLNALSGWKSLRHLRLRLVEGGPEQSVGNLHLPPSLEALHLDDFPLSRIPDLVEALNATPSVTELGLYGIGLEDEDCKALSRLLWIEQLVLENNFALTNEVLGSLVGIETLKSLGLNGTSIHEPWQEIFVRLPQLESLYAWGVPRMRVDLVGDAAVSGVDQ